MITAFSESANGYMKKCRGRLIQKVLVFWIGSKRYLIKKVEVGNSNGLSGGVSRFFSLFNLFGPFKLFGSLDSSFLVSLIRLSGKFRLFGQAIATIVNMN